MKAITTVKRIAAPANLPQSLAWDGSSLWIGSLDTNTIFQVNPDSFEVSWQTQAPGFPWGMVVVENEIRLISGEGDEDDRYLTRLIPGQGFDPNYRIACPDFTGSQLGYDGSRVHLSQWYKQRVLELDETGSIQKTYQAPRGICGQVIIGNDIYVANTADEETNDYYLSRIDRDSGESEDIAHIPFPARALAHDGNHFWTNHRIANETVCFTV